MQGITELLLGATGLIIIFWMLRLNVKVRELTHAHQATAKKVERWEREIPEGVNLLEQKICNCHRKLEDKIDNMHSKLFSK